MILRALYDLAQQEGLAEDLDYEQKPIRFELHISSDGSQALLADIAERHSGGGKGKPVLQKPNKKIPRQFSRPGTKPPAFFIVDTPTFILGWAPPGSNEDEIQKVLDRHQRYVIQVATARDAMATGSQEELALNAFLAFLEKPDRSQTADKTYAGLSSTKDQMDFKSNWQVIVEPYAPQPLHLLPGIDAYWRSIRSDTAAKNDAKDFTCLITGAPCSPVDIHPPVRGVPGGNPGGSALVSFNEKVFESYGLERNQNAPISQNAAEAIGNALNRLLSQAPASLDGTSLPKRNLLIGLSPPKPGASESWAG
jgi:CRISPR-associated protein Csd1